MGIQLQSGDGVAEIVIDFPPVNALPTQGWFDLADTLASAGADPAVHGFCLGGGIGLVGNADIVVAADDATFGLPEVDRGALGAATHLARLVPQHLMRAMVYTCQTASAQQLHSFGSVLEVVPRPELRAAARKVADNIAAKNPEVIRLAKQSLNGIDPVDVKRSYRYEQGFTFELNLTGVSDEARQAFLDGRS